MFVNLPVDVADPAGQLAAVMQRTAEQKSQGVATGTDAVVRLADHIPAALLARASHKYVLAGQARVNVAATNVPGPREVRHLGGRLGFLSSCRTSPWRWTCAARSPWSPTPTA